MPKIINDYIPLIFFEVGALIILDFHCLKTKKAIENKISVGISEFHFASHFC